MIKTFLISILMVSPVFAADNFKPLYPPLEPNHAKATRPAKPVLVEPKALSTVSGTSAKLTWNEVATADKYIVQVATDPNFKWLVTEKMDVVGNTFEVSGLTAGQNYFWRVYGVKSDNISQYNTGFPAWSSFSVK